MLREFPFSCLLPYISQDTDALCIHSAEEEGEYEEEPEPEE
jgi:hypothetical protein